MTFFGKKTGNDTGHLKLKAAKAREEIVIETGIPIPDDLPPKNNKQDEWDSFWRPVKRGQSFVLTESFSHTVKASASKRGIIIKIASVGPFKVRMWRITPNEEEVQCLLERARNIRQR